MQVNFLRRWLLLLAYWLADIAGGEVVHPGWRQIPDGHSSFDPALAGHFKSLNMRNGMHITLAVGYSVIVKWNRFNKKNGGDVRTYGDDNYYTEHYAGHVAGKTWGRHMDELAALGLILVSTRQGKPAYEAVPYQILNHKLMVGSGHDVSAKGHDVQNKGHEKPNVGHDDHPIIESSKRELSLMASMDNTSSTPARAGDADEITKPAIPEKVVDFKAEAPEVRPWMASEEGEDELLDIPAPSEHPRLIPPVAHLPPAPDDDTEPDAEGSQTLPYEDADVKEFQAFFTGCKDVDVKALIAKHGKDRIYALIKAAVGNSGIRNPPGFVLEQLKAGVGGKWRIPKQADPEYRGDDYYTSGKYADFIKY